MLQNKAVATGIAARHQTNSPKQHTKLNHVSWSIRPLLRILRHFYLIIALFISMLPDYYKLHLLLHAYCLLWQ